MEKYYLEIVTIYNDSIDDIQVLEKKNTNFTEKIDQFIESNLANPFSDIPELEFMVLKFPDFLCNIFNAIFDLDYNNLEELEKYIKSPIFNVNLLNINYENKQLEILKIQQYYSFEELLNITSYQQKCNEVIDKINEISKVNNPNKINTHLTVNPYLFNLNILSPKYVKILNNIEKTPGLVFIYSQFRNLEGIQLFTCVLDANGYTKIDFKEPFDSNPEIKVNDNIRYTRNDLNGKKLSSTHKVLSIKGTKYTCSDLDEELDISDTSIKINLCRYALWTGTESVQERQQALQIYNSIDNMYGNNCLILLITKSGAEGISLKFVRQVHIMEPYWNNVRVNQVIGRARRINSHKELPKEEQNVEVFNYIIKFTQEQLQGSWVEQFSQEIIDNIEKNTIHKDEDDEPNVASESISIRDKFRKQAFEDADSLQTKDKSLTSDEVLKDISERKELLLNQFENILKEVAIDCEFNKSDNIRSNNELEKIECYNQISKENFLLNIDKISNIQANDTVLTSKKEIIKSIIIPFSLKQYPDIEIKLLVFTSKEIKSWNELPNGTNIYDYYIYNGLNPDKELPLKSSVKIGIINKSTVGKINIDNLTDDFLTNLELYIKVERCIKQIESTSKIIHHLLKTDKEKFKFREKVKKCLFHNDTNLELKQNLKTEKTETKNKSVKDDSHLYWKCICEKNIIKGEVCEDCDGLTEEDAIEAGNV